MVVIHGGWERVMVSYQHPSVLLTPTSQAGAADDGVSSFVNARSRMLAAAFRTLGNAAEAEEIVQDVQPRSITLLVRPEEIPPLLRAPLSPRSAK
jgi:hypothetical protein